jgi:hypothetical protein
MQRKYKIKWFKVNNTKLETKNHRGYIGTIDILNTSPKYKLTISGYGVLGTYKTLANAKNAFRKFLFNKPVQ